jgi:hypothetical protein
MCSSFALFQRRDHNIRRNVMKAAIGVANVASAKGANDESPGPGDIHVANLWKNEDAVRKCDRTTEHPPCKRTKDRGLALVFDRTSNAAVECHNDLH